MTFDKLVDAVAGSVNMSTPGDGSMLSDLVLSETQSDKDRQADGRGAELSVGRLPGNGSNGSGPARSREEIARQGERQMSFSSNHDSFETMGLRRRELKW